MKKLLTLMLALVLVASMLVGCTQETPPVDDNDTEQGTDVENGDVAVGAIAKVGLGHNVSIAKSKSQTDDAAAQAQADVTVAAVGFDEEGKVASVTIDVAQTVVAFDEELAVAADREGEFPTKKDKQDDYGMRGASAIGKEWFEQMEAFEEWMIGKTVEEITGLQVKEANPTHQHVPDVPELESTVTITVESYIAAVEEAWENAVDAPGAEAVGLGIETGIGSSKDKAVDANGNDVLPMAQMDTYMSATAVDAEGNVVKTIVDVVQVKVNYDAEGQITNDMEAEILTKHELKDDYNMRGASPIGKEWFEQMEAFQEWMIGKTVDEITGLQVKEANPTHQHVPDVPELESTVTITVEGYQEQQLGYCWRKG